MHTKTKALVLRSVDYKESDKILTLLTQELGKITVSARGCRKKGSPIAASCQLLAWSELVLYDYQGRWSVKEGETLRLFQGVPRRRRLWRWRGCPARSFFPSPSTASTPWTRCPKSPWP